MRTYIDVFFLSTSIEDMPCTELVRCYTVILNILWYFLDRRVVNKQAYADSLYILTPYHFFVCFHVRAWLCVYEYVGILILDKLTNWNNFSMEVFL